MSPPAVSCLLDPTAYPGTAYHVPGTSYGMTLPGRTSTLGKTSKRLNLELCSTNRPLTSHESRVVLATTAVVATAAAVRVDSRDLYQVPGSTAIVLELMAAVLWCFNTYVDCKALRCAGIRRPLRLLRKEKWCEAEKDKSVFFFLITSCLVHIQLLYGILYTTTSRPNTNTSPITELLLILDSM